MSYALPYRGWMAGMLFIILATTGLSLLTPLILRDLIDRTLPSRDVHQLVLLTLGLLAIPMVTGALNVWNRQLNAKVGEGVVFDLRVQLFSHLQQMSLSFFTHTKVGELMSRLNNDVEGAQDAISNTLVNIITSVIQAVVVVVVMFSLEWHLTLISIVIFPLFLLAARQLGTRLREITRLQLDMIAEMNAMMNEMLNISGALLVKLFGREKDEVRNFSQRAARVQDSGVQRAVTGMLFFVSLGLLGAVGTALVYGIGGFLVIRQAMTIGTIVALGAYLGNLYGTLQTLANAPVDFATSMVSFERVFEVLDLPLEIQPKPGAKELSSVRGALEFVDVSFRYTINEKALLSEVKRFGQVHDVKAVLSADLAEAGGNHGGGVGAATLSAASQARDKVLDHVSFRADPGQLVALVGPSGAGKTTMTYLIPRLYDPTDGRILIDGYDLRDVTLTSLSAQIGMVTQETFLFHDSIRANLLYARPGATQAETEVAARAANIHDFIVELPEGYDTIVGERGYRLSGGERQRLAIARVILKDPRILVLDEATSSLDSESEALIQEALKRVMVRRTSVVIAHRLSTILAADLILVMNRGRILERGSHPELLALGGLYARLYETQFRRELEERGAPLLSRNPI
jgi:ATP-binding cassette subfamily B protein